MARSYEINKVPRVQIDVPFRYEHGFDDLYGLEFTEVSDELVRGEVVVRDELKQPAGLVHGGVYASIAESLASIGTAARRDEGRQAGDGPLQPDELPASDHRRHDPRRRPPQAPRPHDVGVGGRDQRRPGTAVRADADDVAVRDATDGRCESTTMHETPEDIPALQELLDRSYESAGRHLRSITTPERRVVADELVARLTGMCLLVLATVTADGRPIAGPVDGIFYRGAFHFGTAPDAVRFRHIRKRPQVSATHLPAEEFAVNVHGRAVRARSSGRRSTPGFRQTLLDIYVPRYGPEWETSFLDSGPVYAADRGGQDVHVPDGGRVAPRRGRTRVARRPHGSEGAREISQL